VTDRTWFIGPNGAAFILDLDQPGMAALADKKMASGEWSSPPPAEPKPKSSRKTSK